MINQNSGIRKAEAVWAVLMVWILHVWIAANTPYGVDDWAWGTDYGIKVSLAGELDGRYVSNLFEVIITRSHFLKAILLGTLAALLPAASARLVGSVIGETETGGEKTDTVFLLFMLAAVLFLTIPIAVWRETYGWTCGFTYYGLAVFLLICWQGLLKKAFQEGDKAGFKVLFLYGFFGFCVQLVLENVTVYIFAVNFLTILYSVIFRKKCSSRLLALMGGCLVGTALMFSSSIYESLFNTGYAMGGFRALSFGLGDSVPEILRLFYQRFVYFYPSKIWGNNWVLCCTICLLLLMLCFRQKQPIRLVSSLFCLGFMVYFIFVRFCGPLEDHLSGWNEVLSQRMNLLYFWGVLLLVFLFRWHCKKTKYLLSFLWVSAPGILLPLIAVKAVTYRYFLCSDLFLVEFALALLAIEYAEAAPHISKTLRIVLCVILAGVSLQRFVIYAQIGKGKKDRDARIQQARDGEITRLYFPELPHSEYLWIIEAPDGSEQVGFFRRFYHIPDEVEMSNLPFED
jgi:hypothetical protein